MPFGPLEIGIVLLIVLIIFGPKRLPDLGRSLGGGMREFHDSLSGSSKSDDDALRAGEQKSEPVPTEKTDATPAGGKSS